MLYRILFSVKHQHESAIGVHMERVTWKLHITLYKIDSQWEFAVSLRELKQGLCINLEGWDGEGDGSEVQKGGDIRILMADSR